MGILYGEVSMRAFAVLALGFAGLLRQGAPPPPPAPVAPADASKFILAPVDEREWPLPSTEAEIQKLGWMPIPGGGYQFETRAADGSELSGAVVPGRINMNMGFVELLACGEGGKEHESVLRI